MNVKGQGHPGSKVKATKINEKSIFAQFLGCKFLLVTVAVLVQGHSSEVKGQGHLKVKCGT